MNITNVDPEPMRPTWGRIFHGGWVDEPDRFKREMPYPLAIIGLNEDRHNDDRTFVNVQGNIIASIDMGVKDTWGGEFPDNVLIATVDSAITLLSCGINLYIHCVAGVSRSTYFHCAIRMRVQNISYDDALAQIKSRRDMVKPHDCFVAHLRKMESRLRTDSKAY